VYSDKAAVLAALIAVQHGLDHLADVVAIRHLGALEPDAPGWIITETVDPITGTEWHPRQPAPIGETGQAQ
jgi:hypothetical protein